MLIPLTTQISYNKLTKSKQEHKVTKEYILNFLKTNKKLLNDKYSVTKIGLFGSYAKDMANENSDIDLAIVSTKKDFFLREDLREFLESNFRGNSA